MPKDGERMELSRRLTTLQSTPRQRFFRRLGRRRLCSRAFRASLGSAGQPMRSAISAGLLSSSTPRREIGTSSETILQSFSSAILHASLTSTTLSSATPAPVFGALRITGTSGRFSQRHSFRSRQGIENLTDEAAAAVVANDRESNGRDLLEAIERGDFPRWTLFIQVMTEDQAKTHKHNPFDLTKVWPKADYPLIEVGVMEPHRYPENYFAEVEQAAFSPANVVPGISFSPDKVLQGRLFSYGDTQRYRLGVNFNHIPVNAPQCPFHSYHRDGRMRTDGNLGATTSYNPNSQGLWDDQPEYAEPPLALEADANHYDHRLEDDHWEQPGDLFRKMTPEQKQLLFDNTARAINGASQEVLERHVANCRRADPAYGDGVARALKLDVAKAA